MTNNELYQKFKEISQLETSLDIACELKNFNKAYKKSDFYKQTKMPIQEAYKIYLSDTWVQFSRIIHQPVFKALAHGNLAELAVQLEEFLSTFDYTKLDGLFIYLSDKFSSLNIDREQLEAVVHTELQSFKESL